MGLNAELIAIGPFKAQLAKDRHLAYGPSVYEDVKEGEPVIVPVIYMRTNQGSCDLAEACGTEAWAMGKHVIKTSKINWTKLQEILEEQAKFEAAGEVETVRELAKAGFTFYYLPQG